MKQVRAYIQPHKLDAVKLALHHVTGLTGMSVTHALGWGRSTGKGKVGPHEEPSGLEQHVKVEVFCVDLLLNEVIATIEKAAHTGLRGDGKIYVIPVEEAVRISSGERGDIAV